MTTANELVAEFVRAYAFGLSPRLDELWLRCVAWQIEKPAVPRGEDADPYPRHGR